MTYAPSPIELETLAALEAGGLFEKSPEQLARRDFARVPLRLVPDLPVRFAHDRAPAILSPVATLPDVVAAVDRLADEILAVDLELAAWRTDVLR